MKSTAMMAAVAATLFLAASVYAGSSTAEPVIIRVTDLGEVLADSKGMTLYTFAKDSSAVSNCYDKCARFWPPLEAAEEAQPNGLYSVISRKDGVRQWTYKGMPLYGWIMDKVPGDTTGEGVKGVWSAARP